MSGGIQVRLLADQSLLVQNFVKFYLRPLGMVREREGLCTITARIEDLSSSPVSVKRNPPMVRRPPREEECSLRPYSVDTARLRSDRLDLVLALAREDRVQDLPVLHVPPRVVDAQLLPDRDRLVVGLDVGDSRVHIDRWLTERSEGLLRWLGRLSMLILEVHGLVGDVEQIVLAGAPIVDWY